MSALHPDRNFATIACGSNGAARVLAQLEYGNACALLTADAARRALCVFEGEPPAGIETRATLSVDGEGRLAVAPLRAWLASPAAGTRRAVLNRGAGPYLCRPLQMGADVAVEDLSDLFGGALDGAAAVVARTDDALAAFLEAAGAGECPPPDDGLLSVLDLVLPAAAGTAQARSDRALVAAQFLAHHPAVPWVSYPGLGDDPANGLARKAMEHGFGWQVAFGSPEGAAWFGRGLWPDGGAGARSSRVEPVGNGAYLLTCGLEEALDIVGALENGIACRGEAALAIS